VRVLTKQEIAEACELIGQDAFCADIVSIASDTLRFLDPPRDVSTLEYSQEFRRIRQADGSKTRWSLDLTPFLAPIMGALDSSGVHEVVVPKPARSGGTVVAENYALKTMEFGPSGDIMWYLAGPQEVSSYADRVFKPLFEDHEGVAVKIGAGPSDNKLTMKRIGGYTVELLAMSAKTTTNRQGRFIVFDEPDSYSKKFASNFLEQGRQRQRMVGSLRKIYACAHPDIGWSGGIAQAWLQSSRGIFVMACAECGGHASPYPTKHWPDIPRFRLHYEKSPERTPIGDRLKRAGETAAMLCPHCGTCLDEDQRKEMVAGGDYMHAGQTLDVDLGILGDIDPTITMGFWIHALMVSQVSLAELAREMEGAVEHRERTGKTDKVRQVMVRTFGEVFEGAAGSESVDASTLRERVKSMAAGSESDEPVNYRMGEIPDGVMFVTAAVDTGGNRFDVVLRGWDLERRSWLIDRFTIRQRLHPDGVMRDIRPTRVADDWLVLESQVIDRMIPLQSDPTLVLPVAVTMIDTGDGNATWLAYEFARRMDKKRWADWRKVRCIKGVGGKRDRVSAPTKISKDSEGKVVEPVITLHTLGVDDLKRDTVEDLAIADGSPGQCYFAVNTPRDAFDEFFGETEQEGKWVRSGPNETLDCYAYAEAGRIMLEPDRKDRRWDEPAKRPVWARPISLEPDEDPSEPDTPAAATAPQRKPAKRSILDRFDSLNSEG
jgi:Bacteriophage tail assembly protein